MATPKADPVSSYLTEKKAAAGSFLRGVGQGMFGGGAEGLGKHVGQGALGAAGALAVAGGGAMAGKLYSAATKSRDFRAMLQENPDLAEKHQENPRMVNRFFTTLRTFNPSFSSDPIVAGNYVRQMVDDPLHAGGTVEKSIPFRDNRPAVRETVTRTALGSMFKDEKKGKKGRGADEAVDEGF